MAEMFSVATRIKSGCVFFPKNPVGTVQERQNTEGTIKIPALYSMLLILCNLSKIHRNNISKRKKRHPNLANVLIKKLLSPIGYTAKEKRGKTSIFC